MMRHRHRTLPARRDRRLGCALSFSAVRGSPRHRLATLLGELAADGSFSASCRAPVDDLAVEVKGVGPLRLPVSASQALDLCRIARPARYGRGEATVLDRRVRDTWEVARSRVRIDKRPWNRTLIPALDRLRRDLGLPDSCQLRAELHSMLVYEADQFFAPHQDSEKADDMVGTLVVILPSNATGGELIVRHRGTESVYRSSRSLITFVALYADTVHEVRPLGSGYRVVLTYNLRLAGDSAAPTPAVPASALIEAADLVERHFAEPADVAPWRHHAEPGEPPDRLIYLLDHEYTERGMTWSRLKGDDAVRAGVLRSVADELDLEVVPALAEVHEVWDCIEDDWRYRRTRRQESDDGYELNDLIDSDVLLHLPGRASSRGISLDAEAGEHELCESTPSVKLEPYQSEFEGYTGNAGNTIDRWYRRGALVIWPRARAFAVRARGNPAGALDELLAAHGPAVAGERADLTEIQNQAAMLAPFWANVIHPSGDHDELLVKAMATADLVDDGDLAATLIGPFRIEELTPSGAPVLVRLAHRYGLGWVDAQFDRWLGLGNRWPVPGRRSRAEWLASLPALCAAMSEATAAHRGGLRRDRDQGRPAGARKVVDLAGGGAHHRDPKAATVGTTHSSGVAGAGTGWAAGGYEGGGDPRAERHHRHHRLRRRDGRTTGSYRSAGSWAPGGARRAGRQRAGRHRHPLRHAPRDSPGPTGTGRG